MELFKPGTKAKIGGVECLIVAVMIRSQGAAQYLVSYWNNGSRNEVWVDPVELQTSDRARLVIGLRAS